MDRKKKTILEIAGIAAGFLLLSVLAYFAGSGIAKTFLKAGELSHTAWDKHYMGLVRMMGILSCLLTFGWYLSARFFMKISGPYLVGKRTIWCIIGIVNLLACIAVPLVYTHTDSSLKLGTLIYVLFVLLFGVIGYYVSSLLATPACYKYTPLGARNFRARKAGKRGTKE